MAAYLTPARYPLPYYRPVHGFGDPKLADFIEEDRYFTDPGIDVSHEAAVYMLSRGAGPIYARRSGKRVWFDDLEWDVQCGMLTAITRPIEDKRMFMRQIPKCGQSGHQQGKTSTSHGVTSQEEQHGNPCATESTAVDDADESESDDEMTSASSQASFATANTTPASTPTAARVKTFPRTDSKQGTGAGSTQALHAQNTPPPTTRATSSPHRPIPKASNHPHDIVAFDEEFILIARRHIPWIEQQWHPSKSRGIHQFDGLKKRDLVRLCPGFQPSGTVSATLYGDLFGNGDTGDMGSEGMHNNGRV